MPSNRQEARPQARPESRRVVIGFALALTAVMAALFLGPAASLGFWEPWETAPATLGRALATGDAGSIFAPIRNGDVFARPWLQTALLETGYALGGGSELGFRLPFALLAIVTALFSFIAMAPIFGAGRSALATLLFAAVPATLLPSVNLAGEMYFIAPVTIATVAAGRACARADDARPAFIIALGLALGFCVWGKGLIALAIPLGTIALLSAGTRGDAPTPSHVWINRVLAMVVFLVAVAGPLVFLLASGLGELDAGVSAILRLGASENGDPTLATVAAAGWPHAKDLLGISGTIGLPIALLLWTGPDSRGRWLWHPIATPIAVAAAVVVVGMGASASVEAIGWQDTLGYLLSVPFFTGEVLPAHPTFDVALRLVGAGLFPVSALLPIAFGYLVDTLRPENDETLDRSAGARTFKLLLVLWFAVGFVVVTLGATLVNHYTFPLALPLAAAAALAMTDSRYLRHLSKRRSARYLAAFASIALLAVLSKDVRGTFDEEAGRPGPHVIFESLLVDGTVEFPTEYAFDAIGIFVLLWLIFIVGMLGEPLRNGREVLQRIASAHVRAAADAGRARRLALGLADRALAPFRWIARRKLQAGDWLLKRLRPIRDRWNPSSVAFVGFVLTTLAWSASLGFADMREITHHFSPKGLLDRFEDHSDDQDILYAVGIGEGDTSYYLGGDDVERLDRITELPDLFCDAPGRVFAVIRTEDLAEAYYRVRRATRADDDEGADADTGDAADADDGCPTDRGLYVLDGRSSRYQLISNMLAPDEADENFIAQHVFPSVDALPANAEAREDGPVLDDSLELVATNIDPSSIVSGDVTIDTYWKVLRRVTGSWEIFIHVDYGGNRINGDHEPVAGRYPVQYWVPGDIVRDRYTIEVSRVDKAGLYTVWFGFWRGNDRMEVDPPASDNRVNVGRLRVRGLTR